MAKFVERLFDIVTTAFVAAGILATFYVVFPNIVKSFAMTALTTIVGI